MTEQNEQTESAIRFALTREAIRWRYVHGVPDPTLVDPEIGEHDLVLVSRPGNDLVQLRLFGDYATNPPLYRPCTSTSAPAGCPCWPSGASTTRSVGPAGAKAFARDLPDARIALLDGGHFLLESHLDEVAGIIQKFLAKTLTR